MRQSAPHLSGGASIGDSIMARRPLPLPDELRYLRRPAVKFGFHFLVEDYDEVIRRLSPNALRELAEVSERIRRNGHQRAISQWIAECYDPEDPVGYDGAVTSMLFLLDELGERGMSPFHRGMPFFVEIEDTEPLDWTKLPEELSYLIEPAEKYGVYQCSAEMGEFFENMTPEEEEELVRAYERIAVADHKQMIHEWLDGYPNTEHREASLVFWLLGVMDAMRLGNEEPPPGEYVGVSAENGAAQQDDSCGSADESSPVPAQDKPGHDWEEDLSIPEGLPDAVDQPDELARIICDESTDARRRAQAVSLLCNRGTETPEEGREIAKLVLECVPFCLGSIEGEELRSTALRFIRGWGLLPQEDVARAEAAGFDEEWDVVDADLMRRRAAELLRKLKAQ